MNEVNHCCNSGCSNLHSPFDLPSNEAISDTTYASTAIPCDRWSQQAELTHFREDGMIEFCNTEKKK